MKLYSVNMAAAENVELLVGDDYYSLSLKIVTLCLCCRSGVTVLKYVEFVVIF